MRYIRRFGGSAVLCMVLALCGCSCFFFGKKLKKITSALCLAFERVGGGGDGTTRHLPSAPTFGPRCLLKIYRCMKIYRFIYSVEVLLGGEEVLAAAAVSSKTLISKNQSI